MDVPTNSSRRGRDGAYHSAKVGNFAVVFLDTRFNRDNHLVPSIGGVKRLPFAAVMAAFSRFVVAGLGLGANYHGEVLGETQWAWLDRVVEEVNGDADVQHVVVVSSIQVLTQNPLVESWGHFPVEKRRLVGSLGRVNKNLLFLSGDVHSADMHAMGGVLAEVTSSGMTHTCTEPIYGFVCQSMLDSFPGGRFGSADNYSTRRNYGVIEEDDGGKLRVGIYDAESGERVMVGGNVGRGVDWTLPDNADFHSGFLKPYVAILVATIAIVVVAWERGQKL